MIEFSLALLLPYFFSFSSAATVDLTSANRRPRVASLPDWTQVGYEKGLPLPDSSQIGRTISTSQLASVYGVISDDDIDDTLGLQKAIEDNPGSNGAFTLIQLPAGTLQLSSTIYIDSDYLILRGVGNDPATGTVLSFSPDENTIYDVLSSNGANWDLDGMSFSWNYTELDPTLPSGQRQVTGSATSGWLWPGRSAFRVGSKGIADKFETPASLAPPNRIDFFYGTVNYHWRNDTKIKGFLADQTKEIAGFAGTRKIYVDAQNTSWSYPPGTDVWVAVPVRSVDFDSWQVQDPSFYENSYMFQDWFTLTNVGGDSQGTYIEVDHDLAWNVYTTSVSGGGTIMEGEIYYAKIMPIADPVHHVGIEDLYMTQPLSGFTPADAIDNYGNLAPVSAMNGIVFRYARDCWVKNIRTFMTGSHPIATEAARNLQIQDSYFDGSWNKGAGGNGYLRGSRVWDSLYYNNTLRNLRHFTFQWSSMRNVATMQNMTNDMNLHGGYEAYNLLELNYVSVPYSHRPGSCSGNCGGEGGSNENGTWAPIYWSTGNKASEWSGASGPQNVFYRNYMIKAFTPGSNQDDYTPYFSRDGSLSPKVWQFGWDRQTTQGSRYQHLSLDGGSSLLPDWSSHERDAFHTGSGVGVNGQVQDEFTSLFFRDVTNAPGITTFSSIAGYTYCIGNITPKVVGYYIGSAATRSCVSRGTESIDASKYTHVVYAYATLGTDGTVSLTAAQQAQVTSLVALKTNFPNFKVFIGVGGWSLGIDGNPLITIATSNAGRTKFGTTASTLLTNLGADGIDLEWAPCIGTKCISASQFSTIASVVKSGIGSKLLSLSTSTDFWFLSGVNTITSNFANVAEFVSIITHSKSTNATQDINDPGVIKTTIAKAQNAGLPPSKLLFGVPFYSRPLGSSTAQSICVGSSDIGQGTFPYYSVDSLVNHANSLGETVTISSSEIDPSTSRLILTLGDGSTMFSEQPDSVAARVALAQAMCIGGVTAFSSDQDNANGDLSAAIFNQLE